MNLTAVSKPLIAIALWALGSTALANTPEEFVQSVSDNLVNEVLKNPGVTTNSKQLEALIEKEVLPSVDFEKMTQSAVGRVWRTASVEQRQALSKEFRALLIKTYSSAASKIDKSVKIKVKPNRATTQDQEPVVRTTVQSSSQPEPLQVDYRLMKDQQSWKVIDINVAGIWMVQTYRTQFKPTLESEGVEGLIKVLQAKNK